MQDPPDSHMGNVYITSDIPHPRAGIVLYQIQGRLLIVLRPLNSITFRCYHYEGSAVIESLGKACKKGVAASLPLGVTLGVQSAAYPLQSFSDSICISAISAIL
ncbi:hypothetical protein TNCV_1752561 [Trichonephila clavipes]|nr:hypothetical protein TNCV_1752561 [Trichonephila clavipes]